VMGDWDQKERVMVEGKNDRGKERGGRKEEKERDGHRTRGGDGGGGTKVVRSGRGGRAGEEEKAKNKTQRHSVKLREAGLLKEVLTMG